MKAYIAPCLVLAGLLAVAAFLLRPGEADEGKAARGFLETEFTDSLGRDHTFLVYVPYDLQPGEKRPLLLFLNGLGENGSDGYRSISNNFGIQIWEMKRRFPFICAVPQCAEGESWSGAQLDLAIEFADAVAKRYGTDPNRLYITGVSQGGEGVWNALSSYPGKFAAAVPVCGSPDIDAERIASSGTPIWNIYNEKDQEGLVTANRRARRALLEAGASPVFTEYSQSGHNCWDVGYRSIGLYRWLSEQRRSSRGERNTPFSLLTPEAIVENWVQTGSTRWSVTDDSIANIRSNGDVHEPEMLVCDESYRAFELHLDAFISDGRHQCRIAVIEDGSDLRNPDGYTFVFPLPEAGIGGVKDITGNRLAQLDPLAQRQLRRNYRNDIRIAWQSDRVRVHINGWLALDTPIPGGTSSRTREYQPAIIADDGVRWQNTRIRPL